MTEKNENREINNINKLVKKNPASSFSVPHTNDEKSDGKESKKNVNPSKMTEEKWENMLCGVTDTTDEHIIDTAFKVSR